MKIYRIKNKETGEFLRIRNRDYWVRKGNATSAFNQQRFYERGAEGYVYRRKVTPIAEQDRFELIEFSVLPTSELERMERRLRWLDCLESAGVDNWSGIDFAYELQQEDD